MIQKRHSIKNTLYDCRAYPLNEIPSRTRQGAAIIHMILNNLDKAVAQFPEELVTYGGNGQVLANWAQVESSFLPFFFYDGFPAWL